MSSQYVGPRRPHPFSPAFCWVGWVVPPSKPSVSIGGRVFLCLSLSPSVSAQKQTEASFGVRRRCDATRCDADFVLVRCIHWETMVACSGPSENARTRRASRSQTSKEPNNSTPMSNNRLSKEEERKHFPAILGTGTGRNGLNSGP